jgi:hypothetical protein
MSNLNDPFAGQAGATAGEELLPHRGGKVLVFGILGIALCFVLGIVAWSMGSKDLAAIDSGRMDPAGRGVTRAGLICGKIGTFVNAAYCVVMMIYIVWFVGLIISSNRYGPPF